MAAAIMGLVVSGIQIPIDFVSSLWTATATAVSSFILGIVDFVRWALSFFFSRPVLFFLIFLLIIFAILWLPFHHLFMQGAASVYAGVGRPLMKEVFIPIGESIDRGYRLVVGIYNIYVRFWRTMAIHTALRLPRCRGLMDTIKVVFSGAKPVGRTVRIVVQSEWRTLAGEEIPVNVTQLGTAIFFDYAANVTSSLSGLADCYCTPIGYVFDALTLVVVNKHARCVVANVFSFVYEAQRIAIEFIRGGIDFLWRLALWLLCQFFRTCGDTSPWHDFPLSSILPTFDKLARHAETIACCVGDFADDVTAVVMDIIEYFLQQTFFPVEHGSKVPITGYIKVGGIVRGTFPVAFETALDSWKVFRSIALGNGVSGSDVDMERLFNYYMSSCDDITGVVRDLNGLAQRTVAAAIPVSGLVYVYLNYPGVGAKLDEAWAKTWTVSVAATSTAVDTLFGFPLPVTYIPDPPLWASVMVPAFIIGPRVANHTCQLTVRTVKMIYDVVTQVRSYDDYKEGRYFDCPFAELENIVTVYQEDINEIAALIPAWRSCHAVNNESYFCVPFTGVCSTVVRCDERMFGTELGDLIAAPARIALAAMEYAEGLTRNLDSFDAFRRERSSCIFDHTNGLITALTGVVRSVIVALPLGPGEIIPIIRETGELPAPIVDFILGRKIGKDMRHAMNSAADFLEDHIPPLGFKVRPPDGSPDHYIGIADVYPLPWALWSLPSFFNATGHLIVEVVRFVAMTVHTGDFSHWRFDPRVLGTLVEAQKEFAFYIGQTVTWTMCVPRNVEKQMAPNATEADCPYRLHIDAFNFTYCPLRLMPCPAESVEKLWMALIRLADVIPRLLLYPREDFAATMFGPIICDLQTASAAIEDAFSGQGFDADIPFWKTHLRVAPDDVVASATFAGVKVLAAMNQALVELVGEFVANEYRESGCNDTYYPLIANETTGECAPCGSVVPIGSICGVGGVCRPDGRCTIRVEGGPTIQTEVYAALGSIVNAVDEFSAPLAAIEPDFQEAFATFYTMAASSYKAVADIILAKVPSSDDRISDFSVGFAELTCVLDRFVISLQRLTRVPIMIAGRSIRAVALLAGAVGAPESVEEFGEDAFEATDRLATASSRFVGLYIAAWSTVGKVALNGLGGTLDAIVSGGSMSFDDWLAVIGDGFCFAQEAMDSFPAAVRDLILALDIADTGIMCEVAELAEAVVAVPVAYLRQGIGIVGAVTGSTSIQSGVYMVDVIGTVRVLLIKTGNAVSGVIYRVLCIAVRGESDREKMHAFLDSCGTLVGVTLNLWLGFVESIYEALGQLILAIDFDGGVFTSFVPLCGFSDDPYDIIRHILIAVDAWLRAFGALVGHFSDGLQDICETLSHVLEVILISPESPIVNVITKFMKVIVAFIKIFPSLIDGSIADAATNFAEALLEFMQSLFRVFSRAGMAFLDDIIFSALDMDGMTFSECFQEFWDCFPKILEKIVKSLISIFRSYQTDTQNTLASTLIIVDMFSATPNDPCIQVLSNFSIQLQDKISHDECVAEGAPDTSCVAHPPELQSSMKLKLTLCAKRIVDENLVEAYRCRKATHLTTEDRAQCAVITSAASKTASSYAAVDPRIAFAEMAEGAIGAMSDWVHGMEFMGVSARDIGTDGEEDGNPTQPGKVWWEDRGYKSVEKVLPARKHSNSSGVVGMAYKALCKGIAMLVSDGPTLETLKKQTRVAAAEAATAAKDALSRAETNAMEWLSNKQAKSSDYAREKHRSEKPRGTTPATRNADAIYSMATDGVCSIASGPSNSPWNTRGGRGDGRERGYYFGDEDFIEYEVGCGHPLNISGWDVYLPGNQMYDPCPTWCPDCLTNTEKKIYVDTPCPLQNCPDIINDHPEFQSLCTRLCIGSYGKRIFTEVCKPRVVAFEDNTTSVLSQYWTSATAEALIAAGYGQDITDADIAIVLDPDDDGPLNAIDTCTDIGRYNKPRGQFCLNKCAYQNPTTFSHRVLVLGDQGNLTDDGVQLLIDVCGAFCRLHEEGCRAPTKTLQCTEDADSIATCFQTCDIEWSGGVDIIYSLKTCTSGPLSCYAKDPDSYNTMERTCTCPESWQGSDTCSCTYDLYGTKQSATAENLNVMKFMCDKDGPAYDPVYTGIDNFDLQTESNKVRQKFNVTVNGTLSRDYAPVDIPPPFTDPNGNWTVELPPMYGALSDPVEGPTRPGTECTTVDVVVPIQACSLQLTCHVSPYTCQPVTVCQDIQVRKDVATRVDSVFQDAEDVCATWHWNPIESTLGGFTADDCEDHSVHGRCHEGPCYRNATFDNPAPSNSCIPEFYCAMGTYCPSSESCNVSGPGNMTRCASRMWNFTTRQDTAVIAYETHNVCVDLVNCIGPTWCEPALIVPNPDAGGCTVPGNDYGDYLGVINGLKTWKRANPTSTTCLDVHGSGVQVRLCVDTWWCPGVPGCTNTTTCATCSSCYPDASAPGCPLPTCQYCRIHTTCGVIIVSDTPNVQQTVTVCGNDGDVGCTLSTVCGGGNATAPSSTATCVPMTYHADGYETPSPVALLPPPLDAYTYPWTFSGGQVSCDVPYVNTADYCDYLCDRHTYGAYPPHCDNALRQYGFGCATLADYSLVPEDVVGLYAAQRRFCAAFPGLEYMITSTFPVSGPGVSVGSYLNVATSSQNFLLNSCPDYDGDWGVALSSSPGAKPPCVMGAPNPHPYDEPAPPDQAVCTAQEDHLVETYLQRLSSAYESWMDANPSAIDSEFPGRGYDNVAWMTDFSDRIVACGYVGCSQYAGTKVPIGGADGYRRRETKGSPSSVDKKFAGATFPKKLVLDKNTNSGVPTEDGKQKRDANGPHKSEQDQRGFFDATCYRRVDECPAIDCEVDPVEPERCTNVDPVPYHDECISRVDLCPAIVSACDAYLAENREYPDDTEASFAIWEEADLASAIAARSLAAEEAINRASARSAARAVEKRRWVTEPHSSPTLAEATAAAAYRIQAAACASVPGSAPCRRVATRLVWTPTTPPTARSEERMGMYMREKTPPTSAWVSESYSWSGTKQSEKRQEGSPMFTGPPRTMVEAFSRQHEVDGDTHAVRFTVDPSTWDCWLVCQDYDKVAEHMCFWQAIGRDTGPGQLAEDVFQALQSVCIGLGVGNGSETEMPLSEWGFAFERFAFRLANTSEGRIGESSEVVSRLRRITIKFASKIIGVNVTSTTMEELSTAVVARTFGYDNLTLFRNDVFKWVTNTNVYVDEGPVGALYALAFFTPFLVTCDKINGTHKLFGVIPIYLPTWMPYLPTWVVSFAVDVMKWLVPHDSLVPSLLVIDPSGCANITEPCIPFTRDCDCFPSYKNCGEDPVGMWSPYHAWVYAFAKWTPKVARNVVVRFIAWTVFSLPLLDRYIAVTDGELGDAMVDAHDWCFYAVAVPTSFLMLVFAAFVLAIVVWYASVIAAFAKAVFYAILSVLQALGTLVISATSSIGSSAGIAAAVAATPYQYDPYDDEEMLEPTTNDGSDTGDESSSQTESGDDADGTSTAVASKIHMDDIYADSKSSSSTEGEGVDGTTTVVASGINTNEASTSSATSMHHARRRLRRNRNRGTQHGWRQKGTILEEDGTNTERTRDPWHDS